MNEKKYLVTESELVNFLIDWHSTIDRTDVYNYTKEVFTYTEEVFLKSKQSVELVAGGEVKLDTNLNDDNTCRLDGVWLDGDKKAYLNHLLTERQATEYNGKHIDIYIKERKE